MAYEDKTLSCSDCGLSFTFTAGEQEFFAAKGFTNDPGRCPDCRRAKKQQRGGGYGGSGSSGHRPQREMYAAVCASCGKDTQVPFEPRNGRPVYCSDCYAAMKR